MTNESLPRTRQEFKVEPIERECPVGPHLHRGAAWRVSSPDRQRHLTVCEDHRQAGRDQLAGETTTP